MLGLGRNVLIISLIGFLADLIGGIMSPTQTLFALDVGASITFVGLITAASSLASLLAAIPLGIISDRVGRRPLILGGFTLRVLATLIYATARNPHQVLLGYVLLNVGSLFTFMNLRAYLADTVDPRWIGRAVGIFSTALGAGITIGPLLGGYISEAGGYRQSYLAASALALLGIAVILSGLKNIRPEGSRNGNGLGEQLRQMFTLLRRPRVLWVGLMNVVNFTAMGMIMTYFPVLGDELGYTAETIGTILFIRGLATSVIRIPIGLAFTRFGEPAIMTTNLALEIIGLAAIPYADGYTVIALLMVLEGLTFGGYHTASSSYLLGVAHPSERGMTLGLVRILQGSMITASSYIVGYTADTMGIGTTYLYTALAMGGITTIIIALAHSKGIFRKEYATANA